MLPSLRGQRSDDSAVAELFVDAARRGAVLWKHLSGLVLDCRSDGAQGFMADFPIRGPRNAGARLGPAGVPATPAPFPNDHRDAGARCNRDAGGDSLRASRVPAALGAG